MSASPIPKRDAVELVLGRHGPRWYIVQEEVAIRGGPFDTREEAQAAIDAWLEEIWAYTAYVEEQARLGGYTVAW